MDANLSCPPCGMDGWRTSCTSCTRLYRPHGLNGFKNNPTIPRVRRHRSIDRLGKLPGQRTPLPQKRPEAFFVAKLVKSFAKHQPRAKVLMTGSQAPAWAPHVLQASPAVRVGASLTPRFQAEHGSEDSSDRTGGRAPYREKRPPKIFHDVAVRGEERCGCPLQGGEESVQNC